MSNEPAIPYTYDNFQKLVKEVAVLNKLVLDLVNRSEKPRSKEA